MENKKTFKQALIFTFFSISAGLIQIGSFALLNELIKWPYWPSYLISLVLSILWNFTLNRKYTFKATHNLSRSMLLVFLFYLVWTPISTILGELATKSGTSEYIVLAITMISNLILEFLYTKYIVYKEAAHS